MGRSFFYGSDANLATGAARFSTGITATPTAFGLIAAEATAYAALNAAYQTAYSAASNPMTRTRQQVAAKDAAKLPLRQSSGMLARKITATAAVTDAQLIGLGLEPRKLPTPIPPITVKPTLEIIRIDGYAVRVFVRQSDQSKRGKLSGAYGIQVMSFVGEQPSNDLNEWKIEGQCTVQKIDVVFPTSLPAFTKVWLTAGWITPRLQAGPAAQPVAINLGTFVVQMVEPQAAKNAVKLAA